MGSKVFVETLCFFLFYCCIVDDSITNSGELSICVCDCTSRELIVTLCLQRNIKPDCAEL